MRIRFCGSCGRMILATFSFCPYCGVEASNQSAFEDDISKSLSKLEKTDNSKSNYKNGRFDRILADLENIDKDLEILLNADSAKVSSR